MNLNQFRSLINSHRYILIDFYADWCEPCKYLAQILAELEKEADKKYHIEKIDVDQSEELKEMFSIRSVPTLHFYKDADLIWRYNGFMNGPALHKHLSSLINEK
ncbi:MAG TPA: thioredoxin family protein [Bacteroidia bacterium]|nr:thioredoxin family protein [Bacteroidia bacterium]HNT79687.1 thioredoxin family protein [Bacteroidia bacterium]